MTIEPHPSSDAEFPSGEASARRDEVVRRMLAPLAGITHTNGRSLFPQRTPV